MKGLDKLKIEVCTQNKRLEELGLVILTEGNVSGITEDGKHMIIKPSGVPYKNLTPTKMSVIEIGTGKLVSGLKPSSDTPTHLEIYKNFKEIKAIAHTHSEYATTFAQLEKEIPCYGTTHADAFYGNVPLTRQLKDSEIKKDYELNTGKVISELLKKKIINAVLLKRHAPFCFGSTPELAVDNALILEKVAKMALLGRYGSTLAKNLLDKHYNRKHGQNKYYGQ